MHQPCQARDIRFYVLVLATEEVASKNIAFETLASGAIAGDRDRTIDQRKSSTYGNDLLPESESI